MKIAFCRYNQNTDLDFAVASIGSRNTEERLGILEAMVELGHDVTIISWVPATHMHALKGESKGAYDNSWMTSMNWDIWADIQKFDMVFVETAATNTSFQFATDIPGEFYPNGRPVKEQIGFVEHFAGILEEASGLPILIYHHGSKQLSFPFSRLSCMIYDPMTDAELNALSQTNYRNIFRGTNIWANNDYTVWHKAASSKEFLVPYNTYYYREEMNLDRIKFVGTPIGYSPRYDTFYPPIDPTEAEFDLCYVGRNDRGAQNHGRRPARIHKYYDTDLYTSLLVGKNWDLEGYDGDSDKLRKRYGRFPWKHSEHVTTPGQSNFHGDVFDHYRRAKACVQVLPDEMAISGLSTTRHQQAIGAGCVCFVADDILNGHEWVGGEDFVVTDATDVADALGYFCKDAKMQAEVIEHQRSCLYQWVDLLPKVLDVTMGIQEPDDIAGAEVYSDPKRRKINEAAGLYTGKKG